MNKTAKRKVAGRLVLPAAFIVLITIGLFFAGKPAAEFIVVGDVQYVLRDRDYKIWGDFMEEVYDENSEIEFALFLGDMVENPAEEKDWSAFFENKNRALGDLKVYTTPGNHETSLTPAIYLTKFELPENGPETAGQGGSIMPEEFYSFDYEDYHIVSLNSCFFMKERRKALEYKDGGSYDYEEDVKVINEWLREDLLSTDACWKIVFMHHPLYPVANDDEIYGILRDNWEEIFIDGGVDVVFCGHQHTYDRMMPERSGKPSEKAEPVYVMLNSGQKRSKYIEEETSMYSCAVVSTGEAAGKRTLNVKVTAPGGKIIDKFKLQR